MSKITKQPITNITDEMQRFFAKNLGPGRFARTAYRIREQASEDKSFGINAFDGSKLIGTVSLTPLDIAGYQQACLLGPLLIETSYRSNGLGLELIQDAIEEAKSKDFEIVLLVGDIAYYGKSGFIQIAPGKLFMPGPVDPSRILAYEIKKDTAENLQGSVKAS